MAVVGSNIRTEDSFKVVAGSAKGTWATVNGDARTAQASADKYNPSGIAGGADFHWIEVPTGVTRVLIRARYPRAISTVTTSPVVRVFGGFKDGNGAVIAADGTVPTSGTVSFLRLDNADTNAAGVTLTLTAATTTTLHDTTYWYSALNSASLGGLDGLDIRGADYIGVVVETAASVTAGAGNDVEIQALLLN